MFYKYLPRYFSLLLIAALLQSSLSSIFLGRANAQKIKGFEPAPSNPPSSLGGGVRGLFDPPVGEPDPTVSIGGGRRNSDGKCPKDRNNQPKDNQASDALEQQLIPLLPTSKFGITYSSNPKFYAYIPKTSAVAVVFTLENQDGQGIAQKRLELTNTPSIVSTQFDQPLEIGKDYKWLVSVVCVADDPEDTFSEGIVRRVKPNLALVGKLEKASDIERVELYAKSGIWYEALANLAKLRLAQPNNPEIKAMWINLLKSSGLESLAIYPVNK
ncbi:DUF928 domain-containing protein [Pseudanabaena yagii]|uniref:DUF928 domain-containing protein n=1 Tax=Pseudanabaena yagii GIHE-NHR1 TaxID=2722753 RepID=A0ABX1LY29_9CYAN|nr:DUF928 domain-containing protein [Pseudanabaena yagii]NMF61128.1 DUF928 domain-containing protein [Pseudanabaena yagii GIHE-NHR1]